MIGFAMMLVVIMSIMLFGWAMLNLGELVDF
jgi:hypothetical protein